MKNYFVILFSLSLSLEIGLSQTISGKVIDQKSGTPLSYVHIGIVGKNMGTVSDDGGNFQINLHAAGKTDILRFSTIGYKTLDFSVGMVTESALAKVSLVQETYALPEIPVIGSKNVETENFGFDKATKMTYGWSGQDWNGTELGVPVKGIRNKLLVRSFSFNARFNLYKEVMFRLNIYTLVNEMPGESILKENIFFTIGKDKNWIEVDLRPYQIVIDGNVVVTVEPIKTKGDNGGLFFSYAKKNDGTNTFIRQSSQSNWKIAVSHPFAFFLTVEK